MDAYLKPEAFHQKTAQPYSLQAHARTVYLTSFREGTVTGIPGEARLRALRSFHQMRLRVKPGSTMVKTTNYFTAPGFLSLAHPDPAVPEEDYAFIREFEKTGLFELG